MADTLKHVWHSRVAMKAARPEIMADTAIFCRHR